MSECCVATAGWACEDEERDLVERARCDPDAFSRLYRGHYDAIAAYVYHRLGDVHATEDVVADVFMAALRSLPVYRCRGVPLRAWLYRIATNAVNRWLRRTRKRRGSLALDPAIAESSASVHETSDTDAARAAFLALSPKHQTVLSLHYLEGMSVGELAAVIGCRLGTVKSRLFRAREAMRKELLRRSS